MSLPLIPFYFLRHGQTEWNRLGRGMGQRDIPLNETGHLQAQQAAHQIREVGIKTILSSPLLRAKQTADRIATDLSLPVTTIDDLMECHLGNWEGQDITLWWESWNAGIPVDGVEPRPDFIARTIRAVNQSLTYTPPVLIVAHGGSFSALCQALKLHGEDAANAIPIYFSVQPTYSSNWTITTIGNEGL